MAEVAIKKGEVVEWFSDHCSNLTAANVVESFCTEFKLDFDKSRGVKGKSMLTKLDRLKKKYSAKKRDGKGIAEFVAEKFELPQVYSPLQDGGQSLLEKNQKLSEDNETLKRRADSVDTLKERCKIQAESLKEMAQSVEKMTLEKRLVERRLEEVKSLDYYRNASR